MKKLLFLALVLSPWRIYAYNLISVDGKIYAAKLVEKQISIGEEVATVTENVPCLAPPDDQVILDQMNSEKNWEKGEATTEFEYRKTKQYAQEKIKQMQMDNLLMSANGTVVVDTQALNSDPEYNMLQSQAAQ